MLAPRQSVAKLSRCVLWFFALVKEPLVSEHRWKCLQQLNEAREAHLSTRMSSDGVFYARSVIHGEYTMWT